MRKALANSGASTERSPTTYAALRHTQRPYVVKLGLIGVYSRIGLCGSAVSGFSCAGTNAAAVMASRAVRISTAMAASLTLLVALLGACVPTAAAATALAPPLPRRGAPPAAGQVVLIRHGEKPKHGDGLTPQGEQRAQCLVDRFGRDLPVDSRPRHIWAQEINSHQTSRRPLETVQPLAKFLNLTVDQSFARDDTQGIAAAILAAAANSTGWVGLVCWEHHALTDIAAALGVSAPPDYPSDSFDQMWTVNLTEGRPLTVGDEHCTSNPPASTGWPAWAVVLVAVGAVLVVVAIVAAVRHMKARRAYASDGYEDLAASKFGAKHTGSGGSTAA